MPVYLVSFTLEDNPTYQTRWDRLTEAVQDGSAGFWSETSAFIAVHREESIDAFSASVKRAVDPTTDIVLIKTEGVKSARIIGPYRDRAIFSLIEGLREA